MSQDQLQKMSQQKSQGAYFLQLGVTDAKDVVVGPSVPSLADRVNQQRYLQLIPASTADVFPNSPDIHGYLYDHRAAFGTTKGERQKKNRPNTSTCILRLLDVQLRARRPKRSRPYSPRAGKPQFQGTTGGFLYSIGFSELAPGSCGQRES